MKLILIGYRATGKSTVGRLLSKKLGVPFLDTDCLIEAAVGMPIKEFVHREGWEKFREKEQEVIAALSEKKLCVVATGGGAIMVEPSRVLLKKMGILIYLQASLQDILERLQKDAGGTQNRPQFSADSLVAETVAALNARIPVYESAADFTVDTEGKSVVRVTDEIYESLLESGVVAEVNKLKKKLKNKA